ncbi:hypothetical protein AV530_017316 [Patagioenas fasciata monilis]|uniref:Uncharacterized protein n=1 Tax=Patagioenas fasciata monilis TaxID=372326 RepID=A0A1V4JGV4_PATFA|nr:hypothetical protein AV530_017316 [Patagioenas fasciata monilis]
MLTQVLLLLTVSLFFPLGSEWKGHVQEPGITQGAETGASKRHRRLNGTKSKEGANARINKVEPRALTLKFISHLPRKPTNMLKRHIQFMVIART